MHRPLLRLSDGYDEASPELREVVKQLQEVLNRRGFSLEVDCRFGPEMESAIKKFQEDNGLDADGLVGPLTWDELLEIRPLLRLYDGFEQTSPELQDAVAELQDALNLKGFSVEVDGLFGGETLNAVKKFQQEHDLKVDGTVGPLTWVALLGLAPVGLYPVPGGPPPPETTSPAPEPVKPEPPQEPPETPPVEAPKTSPPAVPKDRPRSIYYKDSERLAEVAMEPGEQREISGTGDERALARIYNRLGGLMEELAEETGIDLAAILAVWKVESGGRDHTPNRAIVRFENHLLYRNWGIHNDDKYSRYFQHGGHRGIPGRPWENHRFRKDPKESFQGFHGDQDAEYEVLKWAIHLSGGDIAYRCISIGGPQILGENYRLIGYQIPGEMYQAFQADERAHVLGFFDFCQACKLIRFLRNQEWDDFARGYNGSGQVAQYGNWIESAFNAALRIVRA
jgi:hypothetical protein